MATRALRFYMGRLKLLLRRRSVTEFVRAVFRGVALPILGRSLARIRHTYYFLRWGRSAPNSKRLIYVDPRAVQWIFTPCFRPLLTLDGTYIRDGQWDRCKTVPDKNFEHPHNEFFDSQMALVPIEKYMLFDSIQDHIVNGTPWNKTEFYIRRSDPDHTLSMSKAALDKYGEHIDSLYNNVKTFGFRTQKQLYAEFGPQKTGPLRPPESEEITLVIGRDGELYLDTRGRHRFIVARILGISEVPARVLVRHKEWQKKRHWVRKHGGSVTLECIGESIADHPDIKDLLS
jgi:hypothetical protein